MLKIVSAVDEEITLPEWSLILSALRFAGITSGQMSRYEQAEAYQALMTKVKKIMDGVKEQQSSSE
jgi:hypothetical protein